MKISKTKIKKLIKESVRRLLAESSKHDSTLQLFPNLLLDYEEKLDAEGNDVTILDLFDGTKLLGSATLTKLTGKLDGHPLRSLDPKEEPRLVGMSDQEYGDAVGADEYGDIKYWKESGCIPNTYSVSSIFTITDVQNKGIGDLMLDLIFYYCEEKAPLRPSGITTDFEGGNTDIINYIIQSKIIKNAGAYYKQTTSSGNDEMDFFGITPDPDDDCYSYLYDEEGVYEEVFGGEDPAVAARSVGKPFGTTSSWRKRGIQSMSSIWDMLTSRAAGQTLDPDYVQLSRHLGFEDAYDNSPTAEDIKGFQQRKADDLKESKSKRKKVDYKKAYKKYHSSPKAKKERAQRNAARRAVEKAGIKIPDGYEIDHKNPISNGGSNNPENLRIIPRSKNRALGQKITTKKRKKKGNY